MARPRQVSDEDILATARAVFLESGPHTSIAVVAKALGVSEAALFKRFHTKTDLLIAALRPPAPPFLARLEAGPDEAPIREQLLDLAGEMARFFEAAFPCFAALKAAGVTDFHALGVEEGADPPPLRTHRALVAWLEVAADRGCIRTLDLSSVAALFLGALHTHAFLGQFLKAEVGSSADHVRTMVDVMWAGIRPEES